jgi:aliphatic nitrilase
MRPAKVSGHRRYEMGERYPNVRVGVVQATAIFLDREASTEKALAFIDEAGQKGIDLLAFPEGFIPAHPVWYHFHPVTGKQSHLLATDLFKNSVEIPSLTTEALCQAAARMNVNVVMGLCEKRPKTTGANPSRNWFREEGDGEYRACP